MNQAQTEAIERVHELAAVVDSGNYDDVVTHTDGHSEGFVVVGCE